MENENIQFENNYSPSSAPSGGMGKVIAIILTVVVALGGVGFIGYKLINKKIANDAGTGQKEVKVAADKNGSKKDAASSKVFTFSDCTQLISEAKLTEIMGHETFFGHKYDNFNKPDTVKSTKIVSGTHEELDKNTDGGSIGSFCHFYDALISKGSVSQYHGVINAIVEDADLRYRMFTDMKKDNQKKYGIEDLVEKNDIGRGAVYIKWIPSEWRGNVTNGISFLDNERNFYASINMSDSDSSVDLNSKLKAIATEIEKNIK